ncbi:CaiB/BaiF CoA transferase family protein [Mycolicibacterium smegmatis]|uniref:L-carnitine dehydratase/bile acid-inducible protein F n=1 Tax=Mycolicibacterium smegmatis (strain MKD8) TaxID=1214915 RepID=A0A2U9PTA1_MYCSE|nr:CaiB/BaiF CoA-transferase family protein [Mycolicibacterium smegmatis]AWT55006.1 L-carnitine dehydratase/bile acid-inducible protein F [Mycolicibacterium smegmatis MKD8]
MTQNLALPLDGIRVVAIEQAVAAPLCSRHLADLGADVIKIERPGGGDFARDYDSYAKGMSSHFVWLNRGKRSVALDLKDDAGREVLLRLLDTADVFLTNLAPGAVDRIIDDSTLTERNPRLVRCAISGYGPDGPYEKRKAFDLLVQGEAGVTLNTGEPGCPAKPGVSLADLGGGIYAVTAILSALRQRDATGRGDRVHVAMFDVLVEWMSPLLIAYLEAGIEIPPAGTRHATITPYGPFTTQDGKVINIAVQNDRQWSALCGCLGAPALGDDPGLRHNAGRLTRRDDVEKAVASTVARISEKALVEKLDAAGVPWGRMNGVADVVAHPQLQAGNRWTTATLPSGATVPVVASPFRFASHPTAVGDSATVPAVGAHTDEILEELGIR